MGVIDDILNKVGLTYDQLTSVERETLGQWTQTLESKQLTVEFVRAFVRSMMDGVQQELATLRETPQNWVGVVALFIPFYGLLKKWYLDQHRIYLEARLRNLALLDAFLTGPEKAREAIDRAIAGIVTNRVS